MNRTPRLGKSGIEYLDYVWNFYSGCNHKKMGVCQVDKCWAEGITKRMAHNYPNGFEPTFYPEAFCSPWHLKKPSIIGCAFMGDLFGDWVSPEQKIHADMPSGKASITMSLKGWIFTTIRQCPQHRFLFLTKNPKRLVKWGEFPDNAWVGVTATDFDSMDEALIGLYDVKAKVKYLSIEPFLDEIPVPSSGFDVDWIILGAQTKPYKPPKIEWVREIIRACDKAGISVFLKDNLSPLLHRRDLPQFPDFALTKEYELRQEMPTIH